MLVLGRRPLETIHLGDVSTGTYPITIHILAVEGTRVKVGIEAPPDINIVRGELLEPSVSQSAPLPLRSAS